MLPRFLLDAAAMTQDGYTGATTFWPHRIEGDLVGELDQSPFLCEPTNLSNMVKWESQYPAIILNPVLGY